MSLPAASDDVVLHVWVPWHLRAAVKMESIRAKENMGQTVTRLVGMALKDARKVRKLRPKDNGT